MTAAAEEEEEEEEVVKRLHDVAGSASCDGCGRWLVRWLRPSSGGRRGETLTQLKALGICGRPDFGRVASGGRSWLGGTAAGGPLRGFHQRG
jgi:hypothetical protein